jgi:uncharacterized protein (TIGR00725 family)
MRPILVGVVGPGKALPSQMEVARLLGQLIATNGWVLVNGGRNAGVMDASAQGAKEKNGLTVGLLPGSDQSAASQWCDIPIATGLNNARNNLISLSTRLLFAFQGEAGTLSEIALALKNGKDVILVGFSLGEEFQRCGNGLLHSAPNPTDAIALAKKMLGAS